MKINVELDATPEEMRRMMGLPDVAPMQKELMDRMQEKFLSAMDTKDPAEMLAPFLPEGMNSLETWQKTFWAMMTSGMKKD
ncbi:MAG: DUF6489 family protein [Cellvibrionaceae bacterium]